MKYGVEVVSPSVAMRSVESGQAGFPDSDGLLDRTSVPPRRGLSRDMTAEPAARAPRSRVLRGTWPSYLGGGRLRTENGLLEQKVARRRAGGSLRRVSVFRHTALLLMIAALTLREESRS